MSTDGITYACIRIGIGRRVGRKFRKRRVVPGAMPGVKPLRIYILLVGRLLAVSILPFGVARAARALHAELVVRSRNRSSDHYAVWLENRSRQALAVRVVGVDLRSRGWIDKKLAENGISDRRCPLRYRHHLLSLMRVVTTRAADFRIRHV